MKRRVVKLGGSLLDQERLGERLSRWLESHCDMQNTIVVGGAKLADYVRELEQKLGYGDRQAHELACRVMRITAKMVACLIPDACFCDQFDQLTDLGTSTIVFDSSDWIMRQDDVPPSWDFTSDSISARLAAAIDAEELVLIKSRLGELDEPGFVDPCFAEESKSIKSVRVCTLGE